MNEPRISLLPGDSGRTFAYAGFIVLRENESYFNHMMQNHMNDERAYEVALAYNHEIIHYLHSITSAYLYSHSFALVQAGVSILHNFDQFLDIKEQETEFERITKELLNRELAFSVRDILEGVAVIEAYKLIAPNPTVENFINRLEYFFGDNKNSIYRKTFDYLAENIGFHYAFHLLSPISYIALQGENPPQLFKTLVENHLPNLPVDLLIDASISDLFSFFQLDIKQTMIFNLDDATDEMKHPLLYKFAQHAIETLGTETLSEIAARPSLSNRLQIEEVHDAILPPVILFSPSGGAKAHFRTFGLARTEPNLSTLIVHLAGVIGAVERLTLYRNSTNLYQFCPHKSNCEHYDSALCFNYFTPPSLELGFANCGFPHYFTSQAKRMPAVAWSQFKS